MRAHHAYLYGYLVWATSESPAVDCRPRHFVLLALPKDCPLVGVDFDRVRVPYPTDRLRSGGAS